MDSGTSLLQGLSERFGIVLKALFAALVLAGLKFLVHIHHFELIRTLPLLTALIGGVVFTLAILLAGVLADFKESERILGELASQIRRIYWDLAFVCANEAQLRQMRQHVLELAHVLNANFRKGDRWSIREIGVPIEVIERHVAHSTPTSVTRSVQADLGNITRIVDRIEYVIETTFLRSGYYYAGTVMAVAIGALTFTSIDATYFGQGLALFGFAAFLLVGLFLLIGDLDNPFAGAAKISTRQMDKVEAWVQHQLATPPPAEPPPS